MTPVLHQVDESGLHVLAWVEDGAVRVKILTQSELQAEHDSHHALINPVDPFTHNWPSPAGYDLAQAKCVAIKAKLTALSEKAQGQS